MEGFARSLSKLPTIICDNAGLDSAELISQIRAEHNMGNKKCGIGMNAPENCIYYNRTFLLDIENGRIADVYEMGVIEPLSVKMCMISSATEAAEQVFILTRFRFRIKKT